MGRIAAAAQLKHQLHHGFVVYPGGRQRQADLAQHLFVFGFFAGRQIKPVLLGNTGYGIADMLQCFVEVVIGKLTAFQTKACRKLLMPNYHLKVHLCHRKTVDSALLA